MESGFSADSLSLLKGAFARLVKGHEILASTVLIVLAILLAVNHRIGEKISKSYAGASGWLALVPLAFLFMWALLREHHEAVIQREDETAKLMLRINELTTRVADLETAPVPVVEFADVRVDSQVFMPDYKVKAIFVFGRAFNRQSAPGRGVTAKKAVPRWECFDLDGNLLHGPIDGRWRDAPSPAVADPYKLHTHAAAIDLEANEVRHEFDLAMKLPSEECFYLIDHKQQAYRLEQTVRLRVVLHGNNFEPITADYTIGYAKGKGGGLSVSREA